MNHGGGDGGQRVVVAKFDLLHMMREGLLSHQRVISTYADGDCVIFIHDGHYAHGQELFECVHRVEVSGPLQVLNNEWMLSEHTVSGVTRTSEISPRVSKI